MRAWQVGDPQTEPLVWVWWVREWSGKGLMYCPTRYPWKIIYGPWSPLRLWLAWLMVKDDHHNCGKGGIHDGDI